jgi:tRNA pseudouridine55 synthase
MQTVEGILLIDKPEGWTSFDVVAKVRGMVKKASSLLPISQSPNPPSKKVKVGHSGTLDPAATGLLVIAVGSYTKRIPELIKKDKTYEVTMRLGQTSTTADKEGDITVVSDTIPTLAQLEAALQAFVGDIMQTPPAFSAIKVNGQRAYDLARKGHEVKLEPRPAKIYSTTLVSYEYPFVRFDSEVGSGTYIRSLVEDIGEKLGTGAYMSDLRRTKVGQFTIADAAVLSDIEPSSLIALLKAL